MGQIFAKRFEELEQSSPSVKNALLVKNFPNLAELPPEISLAILSHLNATDLCLAACVWKDLANAEILWLGLCRSQWKYASVYARCRGIPGFSYRKLYLQLDEATLTFNADPRLGMEYLLTNNLVDDTCLEIAKFFHGTRRMDWFQKREYLKTRNDILEKLVELQNFENQFLPNALRNFFGEINAPNDRGDYLTELIDKFSDRFVECNPKLGFSKDTVFVVCFSLIMLSVDLCSPAIKNKMSKREFIRNTRRAVGEINDDFAGHLYDNIWLVGHVAPKA